MENVIINKRQEEIVALASNGYTEDAIASSLGISRSTVKYHKQKLFRSLGVCSMNEVIKKIYEYKLKKGTR